MGKNRAQLESELADAVAALVNDVGTVRAGQVRAVVEAAIESCICTRGEDVRIREKHDSVFINDEQAKDPVTVSIIHGRMKALMDDARRDGSG